MHIPATENLAIAKISGTGIEDNESLISVTVVIDGIAVGSAADFWASLDRNDVASVEVLKTAAAVIYGSRGANDSGTSTQVATYFNHEGVECRIDDFTIIEN